MKEVIFAILNPNLNSFSPFSPVSTWLEKAFLHTYTHVAWKSKRICAARKLTSKKVGKDHPCLDCPSKTKNFMSLLPILRRAVRQNCLYSGVQEMDRNFGWRIAFYSFNLLAYTLNLCLMKNEAICFRVENSNCQESSAPIFLRLSLQEEPLLCWIFTCDNC